MNQEQLDEVIRFHGLWLDNRVGGKRANLTGVDLSGMNLDYAILENVNLTNANLTNASLIGANLEDANLEGALLKGAKLQQAFLTDVNMKDTDLSGANLSNTTFCDANLDGAKLDYQLQEGLGLQIATMLLSLPELLFMDYWDSHCGTKHCLAGWAVELNDKAKELKELYGFGVAGLLTLGSDWHSMFYKSTGEALEFLDGIVNNSSNNP